MLPRPLQSPRVIVCLLMLAALLLRLYRLDHQGLWYDESFAVAYSASSLNELMARLISDFVHPPAHYLLLHLLYLGGELSSFSARLLSALFGVLTVALMYLCGRVCYDHRTGIIAALLMTVSQLGVMYAQEARPYAMQIFAVTLLLYCVALAIKQQSRAAWWLAVIAASIAIYTQYYSLFVIAPLGLWALLQHRAIGFPRIIIGAVIAAALYLPWLGSGIIDAALSAEKTTGEQPSYFAISWNTAFEVLNRFNNGSMTNVLSGGPRWLYFVGAGLFTAPLILAVFRPPRSALGARATAWFIGAAVTLVLSLVHDTSKSGLVVTAMFLLRGVLTAVQASPLSQRYLFRLANHPLVWSAASVAAFAICLLINAYPWAFFMLGLMLGCILLDWAMSADDREATHPDRLQNLILLLAVIMAAGVPILLGIAGMQFDTRYTLSALPFYYLLVAAGIATIPQQRIRTLLAVALCGYSLVALKANYFSPYKENWRDAMALMVDGWQEGDCTSLAPDWDELPITWYAYGYDRRLADMHFVRAPEVPAQAGQCQRVWFFQYSRVGNMVEAAKPLREGIESVYQPLDEWQFHWVDVTLYGMPRQASSD